MRPSLVIVTAYLLGSVPFGYLIVRVSKGADIRETGSGGTGATNVSRRAGKAAGVVTLFLDALKGAAAVVIAKVAFGLPVFGAGVLVGPDHENAYWWIAAAGIAVIVGHIFPVWLRFRGGKGVATGVGVFLMLAPIAVSGHEFRLVRRQCPKPSRKYCGSSPRCEGIPFSARAQQPASSPPDESHLPCGRRSMD